MADSTEIAQTDNVDQRSEAQRDRDRILYSSAFRRLAGVTQVATYGERRLLHNRLTHSIKTAQVCLGIYYDRRGKQPKEVESLDLDRDVLEAGGLAHDLGHPPYGHVGEASLHELVRRYGGLATRQELRGNVSRTHEGFEGNAQTFRIVNKLSTKAGVGRGGPAPTGLALSPPTLRAVLKYPFTDGDLRTVPKSTKDRPWTERRGTDKWGVYNSEREILQEVVGAAPAEDRVRSPQAVIVDWADDITYAVHDLEDFYRAALIPLHNMRPHWNLFRRRAVRRLKKYPKFRAGDFDKAIKLVRDDLKFEKPFQNTRQERAYLHKWASSRITRFIEAVELSEDPPFVEIDSSAQYEVLVLKELTWYFVIESPALATQQVGHRRIIDELFELFFAWVEDDPEHPRVPVALKETFDLAQRDIPDDKSEYRCARAVADFVADLTEIQVRDLYGRLLGHQPGSMFGLWLQ